LAILFIHDKEPCLEKCDLLKKEFNNVEIANSFSNRKNSLSFYQGIVLPAEIFVELAEQNPEIAEIIPFIPYGSVEQLFPSFLWNAGDYLREPWTVGELKIRLKRIGKKSPDLPLEFKGFQLIPYTLSYKKKTKNLKPTEYSLLQILFENKRKLVDRKSLQLFCSTRNENPSRATDVHISRIRKKISELTEENSKAIQILSIRNKGYTLI